MIVRELITRLGFSEDSRAARRYDRTLADVRRTALATAAAAAAVGTAMAAAARETANAGRDIARAARLANASNREFQRMAAGAQSVGIENEKLSDILKDMNDRVGDFVTTGGGPMVDFFEQVAPKIGVTADMFRDLSGPQALQLYVESLERANLTQAEMTFYMEAIASDSTALLPLLRDNGRQLNELADQAERYGAVLSDDVIKQGETFHRNLKSLQMIVQGLRFQLGSQLLPRLNETAAGFLAWYDANAEIIGQGLDRALGEITSFLDRMWGAAGRVIDVAMTLVDRFGSIEGAAVPLALGLLAVASRFGGIFRVLKVTGLFLLLDDIASWMNDQPSIIGNLLGSYDDFAQRISDLADALSDLMQSLGVPADMADGLSGLAVALGALVAYRLSVALFAVASTALGLGLGALATGMVAAGRGAALAGVSALWSLVAIAGRATFGALAIGVTALGTGLKSLAAGLIAMSAGAVGRGLTALRGVAALGGGALAVAGASVAAGGGARIEGNQERTTTGLYDWLFGGNEPDGARALGGNVSAGQSYLVGERGPEQIFPSRAGYVATHRALRSMMDMASRTRDLVGGASMMPTGAGGGGGTVNNITANVTMQVPPGTPTSQVEYLRTEAQSMFRELLGSEIRKTVSNYPRAE